MFPFAMQGSKRGLGVDPGKTARREMRECWRCVPTRRGKMQPRDKSLSTGSFLVFRFIDLTNQLSPRHKASLMPLWMTVCWFCSLLFTSVEFAHQRKLSTQKYSRWTQKEWENTVKRQLREKFVLCTQEFVKGFVQAKGNYIYELQLIHTRHEVTQDLSYSS